MVMWESTMERLGSRMVRSESMRERWGSNWVTWGCTRGWWGSKKGRLGSMRGKWESRTAMWGSRTGRSVSRKEMWENMRERWGSNWGRWGSKMGTWGCSWGLWGSKTGRWASKMGMLENSLDSEEYIPPESVAHRPETWESNWVTWHLLVKGCMDLQGLGILGNQEWVTRQGSNQERSHLHQTLHWERSLLLQESCRCQHLETRGHRLELLRYSRGSWQVTCRSLD